MIYKIKFDDDGKVISATIWEDVNIPPSEIDANPNGAKFDHSGWVVAENEIEALKKAKSLEK